MTMLSKSIAPTQEKTLPNPHQLFPFEIEEMQSQEHEQICGEFISMLRTVFQSDENANVGGDQGFYWNNEDDRELLAPDAYLIRNVGKAFRKSWKFWEERAIYPNLTIEFALEVWSEGNKLGERRRKLRQYQMLGIQEFFELDNIDNDFVGHRLINGQYELIDENEHGRLFSQALNAELIFEDGLIRIYRDGQRVLTTAEAQAELDAERLAKEAEQQRTEAERQRAEKLAQKLRELGVNPNEI